jgi:hypothetical protein
MMPSDTSGTTTNCIDDKLYNSYASTTTIGGLQKCSIDPVANHGVVGRGFLLDIARLKGKPNLDAGEPIAIADLEAAVKRQNSTIEKQDILVIRTGWLKRFTISVSRAAR